jgi:molecular chaperone Hsp33
MNTPGNDTGVDQRTRFLLEDAGVRGVRVHLDAAWREIRGRADYPPAVAELLGEASAASALLTAHAKVDGRLSLQLRGEGALRLLFAECTAEDTLRGIAQYDEDAGPRGFSRDLRQLGDAAMLAITIENHPPSAREPQRYQGLVPLESDSLAGALEDYFRRSEQLPTRLVLAADERRAAGLMLQKLPGDAGDADGFTRAGALIDTLTPGELLDWADETLLHRLYHEETVRLLDRRTLRFACSCSRERVASVLQSIGREEALAAAESGVAEVRCEFCGQRYHFDADAIAGLFDHAGEGLEPPERLQ